jgi:hypothetical protein
VFRLNATAECQSGSESAFRRNTAEHVYTIAAAHNPEFAGSNPAPATAKRPWKGPFPLEATVTVLVNCKRFCKRLATGEAEVRSIRSGRAGS